MTGYNFHFLKPSGTNNYGGVGIYVKQTLTQVKIRNDLELVKSCQCQKCQHESLWIEFVYNDKSITIGGIYRHPNGNIMHFINDMSNTLDKIDKNNICAVAGDINIDLININKKEIEEYLTTMMSYKFIPLITHPTRITYHSATCLDHIFIKLPMNCKETELQSGIFFSGCSPLQPPLVCRTRRRFGLFTYRVY